MSSPAFRGENLRTSETRGRKIILILIIFIIIPSSHLAFLKLYSGIWPERDVEAGDEDDHEDEEDGFATGAQRTADC